MTNSKLLFFIALVVLGLLMPGAQAWAADGLLEPAVGGNAWDLYVAGNGKVVYQILMGVKMLMIPDAGETGFKSLLLLMSTLGFLVLAIGAGFNPSKGFVPMFGYIMVVWMVTWMSTKMTANLVINDMVVTSDGYKQEHYLPGAPALVAIPAALTSQVGHYFTQVIETYMSTPNQYKMASEGGVAQFNLFAKMAEDTSKLKITDPNLRFALTAYITDCAVPAIAMGNLKYEGNGKELYGSDALLNSPSLIETLRSAQHKSIHTRTYPTSGKAPSKTEGDAGTGKTSNAMGELATCHDAYTTLEKNFKEAMEGVIKTGNESFGSAGVLAPYETVFQTMMAKAGNGSTYGSANGMLTQTALINSMSGAFQGAAMQTGNNELIMAANLTQAEQAQKTSWAASFYTFNNMMGYVYSTLQALIFALTPMIVVALLIPGMGKSIFTNYAQILVWLTLWEPALAIVNFIITLFAIEGVQAVVSGSGGITVSNQAAISERTSSAMLAAGFLGTMTPMITWGIVKGAMAFTEFINAGIGSQFAQNAATQTALGAHSSGTVSMNTTSMNSYSTAHSASVGTQGVQSFTNAGAHLVTQDAGGTVGKASGQTHAQSRTLTEQAVQQRTASVQQQQVLSEAFSNSNSMGEVLSKVATHQNQRAAASVLSNMRTQTQSLVDSGQISVQQGRDMSAALDIASAAATQNASGVSASAGIKRGKTILPIFNYGVDLQRSINNTLNQSASAKEGVSVRDGMAFQALQAHSTQSAGSSQNGDNFTRSITAGLGVSEGQSWNNAATNVIAATAAQTMSAVTQYTNAIQAGTSAVVPLNSDMGSLSSSLGRTSQVNTNVGAAMGDIDKKMEGGLVTSTSREEHLAKGEAAMAANKAEGQAVIRPHQVEPSSSAAGNTSITPTGLSHVEKNVADGKAALNNEVSGVREAVKEVRENGMGSALGVVVAPGVATQSAVNKAVRGASPLNIPDSK